MVAKCSGHGEYYCVYKYFNINSINSCRIELMLIIKYFQCLGVMLVGHFDIYENEIGGKTAKANQLKGERIFMEEFKETLF